MLNVSECIRVSLSGISPLKILKLYFAEHASNISIPVILASLKIFNFSVGILIPHEVLLEPTLVTY